MLIVALIFHALLYTVLASVLALAAWGLRLWLKPSNARLGKALKVAPFIVAGLPLGLYLVWSLVIGLWLKVASPSELYERVFSRPAQSPPLHGQSYQWNGGGAILLAVPDSEAAVKRALATSTFRPTNAGTLSMQDDPPPSWWGAWECAHRTDYVTGRTAFFDETYIFRCPADATVYIWAWWTR